MLVADPVAEARRQQARDFRLATREQEALVLAAPDEGFDFLEIVDRNLADVGIALLGKERAGADEAEELLVNLARGGEVDRGDAVLEGAAGGADDRATQRGAFAGEGAADVAQSNERV